MQTKVYSEFEDFPFIALWAHKRGMPLPNPDYYGECGMIILDKGIKICSGFLIRTDCKFALIGNIMSNPDVEREQRDKCLDFMIVALLELARQCGFKLVCGSSNSERLLAKFEKHGFLRREKGITMTLREE